ncbi:hypothetical protein SH449x_002348 [Pirellulaceae bacterium SH449]
MGVRELRQVVVIDPVADENSQEIFETLNARGPQLTSTDLIKNVVFQQLLVVGLGVVNCVYGTNGCIGSTPFAKPQSLPPELHDLRACHPSE